MQQNNFVLSAGSRVVGIMLAAAALVAALSAGGCGDYGSGAFLPKQPFPTFHQMPCWSSQDLIAYRDEGIVVPVPPDGSYTVDFSLRGIWVLDTETGEAERIPVSSWSLYPAWSPDGSELALVIGAQIYTMNADGTGLTQLTFTGTNMNPDWSPDGGRIAWERLGDSASGVWIMSSTGDNQQHVIPLAGTYDPDWHPTEEVLLCAGWYDSAQAGIFEYDLLSESVTVIRESTGGTSVVHPQYSPDGSRIAFCAMDMPEAEVWVMDADGLNARQLTWEGGSRSSWSPDGTRLVYTRQIWDDWDMGTFEDGVLWVVDVETGEREQLTFQWEAEGEP